MIIIQSYYVTDSVITSHKSKNIATRLSPNGAFVVGVHDKNGSFQHPIFEIELLAI